MRVAITVLLCAAVIVLLVRAVVSNGSPLDAAMGVFVACAVVYIAWFVGWRSRGDAGIVEWKRAVHARVGWGLVGLITVIAVAYLARQDYFDGEELDTITITALSPLVNGAGRADPLYVKVGPGGGLPPRVQAALSASRSSGRIEPWSSRPACGPPSYGRFGACGDDDFLEIRDISMPLWHVAWVEYKSLACAGDMYLVKGFARWHVISHGLLTCT